MRRKKRKLYWSFISKDRQGLTAENIKEGIPGIGNSIVQNLTDVEKQGDSEWLEITVCIRWRKVDCMPCYFVDLYI